MAEHVGTLTLIFSAGCSLLYIGFGLARNSTNFLEYGAGCALGTMAVVILYTGVHIFA